MRALGLSLFAAACAPNPPPPVDVVALVYNYETRVYEAQQVTLTTPTDITTMTGPVAKIYGGASFVVDDSDPALQAGCDISPDDALLAIRKREGGPVSVAFIESQGVLVPADFHALNITTTYYNFERAYNFYNRIATLKPELFGTPTVYYWASLVMNSKVIDDNAMFMGLVQGFLVLPFDKLQQVPLSINGGVVGHEYSHAVFNYRVMGSAPLPKTPCLWENSIGATPGANLLTSLDEGSADVFGYGVTCDDAFVTCNPEFLSASLPSDYNDARRLDKPHCLDAGLWQMLKTKPYSDFINGCEPYGCQYMLASVFSSAMWRAASDDKVKAELGAGGAQKQMFQALWYAQGGGNGAPSGLSSWRDLITNASDDQLLFSLDSNATGTGSVLDAVIDGATSKNLKAALCSAFLDRFNTATNGITIAHCPVGTQSYKECTTP